MGSPCQSYGSSLVIWDHTVLPATRHKWTCSALTPATQAVTRFTYPGGMEGWVYVGSLIAAQPGIKPTTAWSQVQRRNRYATKPPLQLLAHMCCCRWTPNTSELNLRFHKVKQQHIWRELWDIFPTSFTTADATVKQLSELVYINVSYYLKY